MRAGYSGRFKPKHPTKYNGDPTNIIFRSLLERSCMLFFDSNPNVISWSSEEVAIPYFSELDNKWHRYFVDFIIELIDKNGKKQKIMIEVKPFKQTQQPVKRRGKAQKYFLTEVTTYIVNQAKWKAAEAYCKKNGMTFKILTERDIRKNNKDK